MNVGIVLDVSEYWKRRGPEYQKELQSQPEYAKSRLKDQEKFVMNILGHYKFNRILEIGCGTGRYTEILSSYFRPEKYVAIDISNEQIETAKKNVSNKEIEFQCTKIQDFNSDEKFDLVFASEVLMHIDFESISSVIEKIVSLSTNKIISIDWFDERRPVREFGGYCFMHDYQTLFHKNNVKNVKIHVIPLSTSLKLIGAYSKFRGRHGIDKQAVIEVDV